MSTSGRLTASATVLGQLRHAISTGALLPGQQLVQESLAESFGVSRVPLREALQVLEGEGQVVHEAHRGYFVAELSIDDLVEVYRLRALLEGEAARAALPLLTEDDITLLAHILEGVDRAADIGDVGTMTQANRQFHFALIDAAQMPRLSRIVSSLWDATDVYRTVYYGAEAHRARVAHEHAAILAAIRRRDADALVAELDAHREHAVIGIGELSAHLSTQPSG